jgi:hypothetical protein
VVDAAHSRHTWLSATDFSQTLSIRPQHLWDDVDAVAYPARTLWPDEPRGRINGLCARVALACDGLNDCSLGLARTYTSPGSQLARVGLVGGRYESGVRTSPVGPSI